MWYLVWILGLPLAAACAILSAMWLELKEDDALRQNLPSQPARSARRRPALTGTARSAPSFRHGVQAAGADLIHFGRVMMTATPVGVAMFAVCGIMKCAMHEYTREAIPFISAAIAPILLMIL